jgi:predicted aldo/keto reductase-like oxidoreductase
MKTIRLGATALEISEIGFGGIPIIPLPQEEAVSVVRHCFDLGITFFDTANMYPTSEEKLGIALKPHRKEVGIATKTAQRTAKGAEEHLDLSLGQLQTDWIDVYQLHKEIENIRSALGEKFCHRCEYCMPCEQGVQIPSVLMFKAVEKRLSREIVKGWIGKAMESVEQCIECGECEQRCPYHLPIADLLKENLALYSQYARD